MIVGDTKFFAIESSITRAFPNLSQRALGYFVIHIGGKLHGVRKPDASMLGCSFDGVNGRLQQQGTHQIPLLSNIEAALIAEAYLEAVYTDTERTNYFGLSKAEFADLIHKSAVVWAPDGDEAFDDGNYILQFDVESKVRLIAFKNTGYLEGLVSTVAEEWLDAEVFYNVLSRWSDLFAAEWAFKIEESGDALAKK
ncbi:Imm42 family immunity protein [Rhizobium sp. A22-96]